MDQLFCDQVDLRVTQPEVNHCMTADSVEGAYQRLLALRGLELIDYGTARFIPCATGDLTLQLRSKAWAQRVQRQA